jgi:hypothetical protein
MNSWLVCRFRKRYNFLFDEDFPAEKEVSSVFIFKCIDQKMFLFDENNSIHIFFVETAKND